MGTPEDIVLQTALKLGLSSPQNLVEHSGLEQEQAQQALNALIDQGC